MRGKIIWLLAGVLLLNALCVPLANAAIKDGDWQYWNGEEFEIKLQKKWKIKLEEELRFGESMGKLFYEHTQIGSFHDITPWFNLAAGYRDVFCKGVHQWQHEAMPFGEVMFKSAWNGFNLSDKSRLEYRMLEARTDNWRYRNKVTLKLPWRFTQFAIRPYVSNEFLIQMMKNDGYNENRLYGGLECTPWKNVSGDIFYLWQDLKRSAGWEDRNIFGSKLKISF
jgi:hypothetical protein